MEPFFPFLTSAIKLRTEIEVLDRHATEPTEGNGVFGLPRDGLIIPLEGEDDNNGALLGDAGRDDPGMGKDWDRLDRNVEEDLSDELKGMLTFDEPILKGEDDLNEAPLLEPGLQTASFPRSSNSS